MLVAEVMTRDVKVADPERTVKDASKLMAESNAGALPIGKDDRLIGMITDRDIVVRVLGADKDPATTKIREAMTEGVEYCFEDDDISSAADHMAELKVRRLAVLNTEKRLVGIVSLGDLAAHASRTTTA